MALIPLTTTRSTENLRSAKSKRKVPSLRHALIVQPDPEASDVLSDALLAAGFTVSLVESGVSGIYNAREMKPDLIVFDLQLRDVDGVEFLRWLRTSPGLKDVPVIAIDGTLGNEDLVSHKQVQAVLRKPLSPAEVHDAIRNIPAGA